MIANDGNIMEHAIPFDGSMDLDGNGNALEHKGQLPAQAIGERYDIIVNFAKNGIMPGAEPVDRRGHRAGAPVLRRDVERAVEAAKTAWDDWRNKTPRTGWSSC